MPKLEGWKDLFKFNKGIFEDDYYDGEKWGFVTKLVKKASEPCNSAELLFKQSHPDKNNLSSIFA